LGAAGALGFNLSTAISTSSSVFVKQPKAANKAAFEGEAQFVQL
jgi:hypothetical protein